ncbi:MAG: hypothetical protein HY512_02805 [Candidatus Aenigmarchaeota archaeon]|nr:hypothetical protein [Candidatus Aenigmarchaeota archaeon]
MMINSYFEQIEKLLSGFPYIVSIESIFDAIDVDRGYFRIKLKLIDQSELYLFEYVEIVNSKPIVSKYRYHWQNNHSKLIMRWDNAPHHPEIETFPDHIHNREESKVEPAKRPNLNYVLLKVSELIESKVR